MNGLLLVYLQFIYRLLGTKILIAQIVLTKPCTQRLAGLPPHPFPSPRVHISPFFGIYCVSVCFPLPHRMLRATSEHVGHILCYFSPQTRAHSTQPSQQNAPPAHWHQHRETKHAFLGSPSTCVQLGGRSPSLGQPRAQQTCRHCALPAFPQPSQHRKGAAAVVTEALLCTELIAAQPRAHLFRGLKQKQLQQKS